MSKKTFKVASESRGVISHAASGRDIKMSLPEALQWCRQDKAMVREYQMQSFTIEQVEAAKFVFDTLFVTVPLDFT